MLVESIPAQDPTRPSFITPFGLAVEACSELRKQSRVFLRAQGAGREIGSGWQYLNTFFIPETVQFGGFIYAYMASHCCAFPLHGKENFSCRCAVYRGYSVGACPT